MKGMKKNGNAASNLRYNPRNQKPDIPIDADEIDGAMERFIREKYQHKTLSGEGRPLPSIKHHTGSSSSSNDVPPPLPPKSNPRLGPGMRSQSSTYPTSQAPLPSPPASDWSSGGSRNGDSRRMAGIPEGEPTSRRRSLDIKLDQLREMGFSNDSKNATVLKGVSGSVDKAVDALNRLGEGYGDVLPRTRPAAQTNGISFERPQPTTNGASPAQNFSPQQTGQSQNSNSSNPFFQQQQQVQPIQTQYAPSQPQPQQQLQQAPQSFVDAFQNMQISQAPQQQPQPQSQSQPLFPNNTGSWMAHQLHLQRNPFLKTWTPPMSPSPYQYTSSLPPTQPDSNPFLRSAQLQAIAASNQFGTSPYQQMQQPQNQQQQQEFQQPQETAISPGFAQRSVSMPVHSPYGTQAQQQAQDFFQIQPQQQYPQQYPGPTVRSPGLVDGFANQQSNGLMQQQQQQQPPPQQYPSMNNANNVGQSPQQQYENQQWQQQHQQPQYFNPPQQQQQPPRHYDKSSILAMYNTPTPQNSYPPPDQQQQPLQQQQQQQPQQSQQQYTQPQAQPQQQEQQNFHPQPPQRSVIMPVASTNPFAPTGHVSRESVLFTGQGMPGRSASPDAFAGLSARWR